jgi:hypothetical protein
MVQKNQKDLLILKEIEKGKQSNKKETTTRIFLVEFS